MEKSILREKYAGFARWYDMGLAIPDALLLRRLRRRLLSQISGCVLETGIGTGRNLPFYPSDCKPTGVDLSIHMLEIARRKAGTAARADSFLQMDSENLAFRDDSFDTVIDSFNLCTYPKPLLALREMGRVCRSGGRILLLEHGRSVSRFLAWLQDRTAAWHASQLGCHWKREPLDLLTGAGLQPVSVRRVFFGIFYVIEAKPGKSGPLA